MVDVVVRVYTQIAAAADHVCLCLLPCARRENERHALRSFHSTLSSIDRLDWHSPPSQPANERHLTVKSSRPLLLISVVVGQHWHVKVMTNISDSDNAKQGELLTWRRGVVLHVLMPL